MLLLAKFQAGYNFANVACPHGKKDLFFNLYTMYGNSWKASGKSGFKSVVCELYRGSSIFCGRAFGERSTMKTPDWFQMLQRNWPRGSRVTYVTYLPEKILSSPRENFSFSKEPKNMPLPQPKQYSLGLSVFTIL